MKRILLSFTILLLIHIVSHAQTITIEADTGGYQNHYIYIDVIASGFPSTISVVYIMINIDPDRVQYVSKTNGTAISYNVSSQFANRIFINKFFDAETNINGTLATLCLHYDGGTTSFEWNESNDISGYDSSYVESWPLAFPPNFISFTGIDGGITETSYIPRIYYVDKNSPAGTTGNGLSWATAFDQISDATVLNLRPGEKVLIKPETYNERVVIKSNAGYAVKPQTGVVLSDTNKITFPTGTNLSGVDLVSFPDQYYAYVYRSWSSNNGYYKITEVNDALDYLRVEGSAFIPETGVVNHRGKVMAAVARPVVYKKDPAALESQRVVINPATGTPAAAVYFGTYFSRTNADSANWNLVEGIDINNTVTQMKGVQIHCSSYNIFAKGKIYCTSNTTFQDTGVYIQGISTSNKNPRFNIIQNNEIYNTSNIGISIGYATANTSFNYSHYNHIIDNNFYLSGSTTAARIDNMIKIQNRNKSNVIDGNNFHDFKIYTTTGNGALWIGQNSDSTLISHNIFKNIGKETGNSGINACVQADSGSHKVIAYNNIIYNDDTVANDIYAFRIYGTNHFGSKVVFNTIHKIARAFYLQDNIGAGLPIDFAIQDNIMSPSTTTYFTEPGTTGRFTVNHNLYRNTPAAYASDNVVGNPLFIEPDGSNMYGMILQPTSPAMDAGTPVTNLVKDYLGEVRDSSLPSMGAFENTMTCTWTGATSTDWHINTNWLFNMVPQNYMYVKIPNVANDPVINASNAVCTSVSISSGALIRLQSSKTLTIY